jgi:hypothetical protein
LLEFDNAKVQHKFERRVPLSEMAAFTMLTLLVIVVLAGQTGSSQGPASQCNRSKQPLLVSNLPFVLVPSLSW